MIAAEDENTMPKELVRATPSCQDIAERGEAIYGEKYRTEMEKTSNGKFIAINVANADATIAIRAKTPSGWRSKKTLRAFFISCE
jgi:hypothetical protein